MSEAELHQIRLRLHQGERQKAARGELYGQRRRLVLARCAGGAPSSCRLLDREGRNGSLDGRRLA